MREDNSRFLKACRGEPVDATPVWFMRQAGRYMAEYRKIREQHTLLEICARPELIREVTLQPLRRFDLDAAIIFADILLPLKSMGLGFDFATGEGPVIANPVRGPGEVERLGEGDPEQDLASVLQGIAMVSEELRDGVALIGFAGAPFTLAAYMIEGRSSRNFARTKLFMYTHEESWNRLLSLIARLTVRYLKAQVAAGARVVQLFDSWVGCLEPADYRRYVLPHSRAILSGLASTAVPTIHFGTGTATLLGLMREAGGSVLGLDWRVELDRAWKALGYEPSVQGNLEPVALLGPKDVLEAKVDRIVEQAGGRPGHIFNLGHGILPGTPVENVEAVVEWVHEKTRRSSGTFTTGC